MSLRHPVVALLQAPRARRLSTTTSNIGLLHETNMSRCGRLTIRRIKYVEGVTRVNESCVTTVRYGVALVVGSIKL